MRGHFPAALAYAVALAACGGVTERQLPRASGGAADGSQVAGAPGSAGAPPGGDVCECAKVEIGWWVATASAPPTTEAHITPCNAFSFGPAGAPECRTALEDCSQVFNMKRLAAALAQPDVKRALEQAPVLYGRDLRGIGGQVDHIEIGGKVIELGDECDAVEPCPSPIPDGLSELAHLLGRITLEQRGSCTMQ